MQWQLLWYVLAGLIIGLTASTLWEWLYFRRKRLGLHDQRVTELEAEVRLLREQNQELIRLAERPIPIPTDYHSPAVFLESEEAESLRDEMDIPQPEDASPVATLDETPMVDVEADHASDAEREVVIELDPDVEGSAESAGEVQADEESNP